MIGDGWSSQLKGEIVDNSNKQEVEVRVAPLQGGTSMSALTYPSLGFDVRVMQDRRFVLWPLTPLLPSSLEYPHQLQIRESAC